MKFKGQVLIMAAVKHPALATPGVGGKAAVPRSPDTAAHPAAPKHPLANYLWLK